MPIARGVVQTDATPGPFRTRLRGEDSDGDLALVEIVMGAGAPGPPLHVHPLHGEAFYILSGEVTFQVGEEIVSGGPGSFIFVPKETPHTLANLSRQEARLLVMFAPAGFERRFEEMYAEQAQIRQPAEAPTTSRWTRMVGPPLSAPSPKSNAE